VCSLTASFDNPIKIQSYTHETNTLQNKLTHKSNLRIHLRIPLMADSDSIPIADSIPFDGGHRARVSGVTLQS
jgi:hypothetical protein